ncbi:MAG: multicopper oxidase domain-containing protein [Candidatus Marinimicrobia bacterium]|nr:multicopper oxidase domain-containing protein [Candidatus Neomarinimicrobiota bacterium]
MNRATYLICIACAMPLFAQTEVTIPDTLSGQEFHLVLQNGNFQFQEGIDSETMGVNGPVLGPTLIMEQGQFADISVENQLGEPTTIHWHGLHVSAENDGGPHTVIHPGETWNPQFTVLDKAGTYWYHPHLHEHTDEHVSKGLSGFIIVKDDEEAALELPRTYGVDDFPLVIQTKSINPTGEIVAHTNSDTELMVNAVMDPRLVVPEQVVRFRLLNGSSQRVFNFGLSNNQSFHMIASDGGLLNVSVELTRLMLAPGERAEILVDFALTTGSTTSLLSYAAELQNGIYGAAQPGMMSMQSLDGYNPNPLNGSDFEVMRFEIVDPTVNAVTTIVSNLASDTPLTESESDITRQFTLTPEVMGPNSINGDFLINGSYFDMETINEVIPLNNIEVWSITNQSPIAHPFHIHDVQFYVLDRNGVPPAPTEQGRKDVVLVKPMETVRFITKFEDFANPTVPFMYHCHMLTHEDAGMMGQFIVVDPLATNSNLAGLIPTVVTLGPAYPNPFNPTTTIRYDLPTRSAVTLGVYDITGRTITILADTHQPAGAYSIHWNGTNDLGNPVSTGMYFCRLEAGDYSKTIKMVYLK